MDKLQLVQKTIWSYGEDGAKVSAVIATIGTLASHFLGGWDNMIQALILFMVLDFAVGFIAAAKNDSIDSKVMFWGGVNKLLVLVFVGVGVILDGIVGMNEPYIRTAIIWFYIGREGLSMVENYGKMGLPLPQFITKMLEQLKSKGDNPNATTNK